MERAYVLRDQLYPIKVINIRANIVLILNRTLKVNVALEIIIENKTELVKIV